MTIPELPDDLVEEILSRVPATHLKRLRSTCKLWNRLFNDDWRFARKHSKESPKQFTYLIMTKNFNIAPVSIDLNTTVEVKTEIEHSFNDPRYNYPVKFKTNRVIHCDGVLLCANFNKESITCLWNPLTGEKRWIKSEEPNHRLCMFHLGYSQGDKDKKKSYKVLSINRDTNVFRMYEFDSNTWRSLGNITPDWRMLFFPLSLKGNTYVFAEDETKKPSIISLLKIDYTTEKSVPVPLPYDDCIDFRLTCLSVVREEKLAVLLQRDRISKTEVWVTNKIDDETTKVVSWSKVLALDLSPDVVLSNLGSFLLDEEKKVLVYCGTWCGTYYQPLIKNVIYIVGEDNIVTTMDFGVEDLNVCWLSILNYVPSLDRIKPHQGKRKRVDVNY
ncbi:hypothetical protein CARUB_v10016191mg [Capsella rubella]|uniref:F-box domain-containing protein n=1 Tax=Capsella rubella TaxID=81985 RepID=R0GBA8_9BRAS|nr:F-box protein ETP2 [Capsella rubella]EOA32876.1 hypothetical protein CARUB_v10016191mg [Capsella rubella]